MNGWYIAMLDHTTGTGKDDGVDGREQGATAVISGRLPCWLVLPRIAALSTSVK